MDFHDGPRFLGWLPAPWGFVSQLPRQPDASGQWGRLVGWELIIYPSLTHGKDLGSCCCFYI